ncbi:MAG: acetolactate synthase small subunit, partial [Eubacterium sp.]
MRKVIFSLLVENTSGVLSHISGLFSRRGYNIDSFSAGITADPRFTRITIVSTGDDDILEQIEKQLAKLEDVIDIKQLRPEDSVTRELILVKIHVDADKRSEILSVANIFRANIIDVSQDSMIVELTGTQSKLDAFVDLVKDY